jgi:subtilisin family serine protease
VERPAFRGLVIAAVLDLVLAAQLVGPAGAGSATQRAAARAPIDATVLAALSTKGQTTAWVVLKAHADLGPAFTIKDWNARGRFVYERLTATAAQSQARLTQLLTSKGVQFQSFWILNSIRLTADAATFNEVTALPEVAKVVPDLTFKISPTTPGVPESTINTVEWGVDRVNAPLVWGAGDRGDGIVVGTIDTGALYTHPALVNQYRGNNHDGTFNHNYNWWDPSNVCGPPASPPPPSSLVPCDNNGHGTHTMGTIVGDDGAGNQVGVAPHATWIAAKGCESGSCSSFALLSSGQFMLAPTDLTGANANASKRPQLVSNSWGDGPSDPFYQATVQAWVASGIFPVFANGNAGPGCGSVGVPGAYPESYGVGAFDINNVIASFSSRGPSAFGGDTKPNISAPGVNVRSSWNDGGYNSISGTSMATPHVAGVVALLLSGAPSLIGDIAGTRSILDSTAIDMSDLTCGGTAGDNDVWGEGRVDAWAAYQAAPTGPTGVLTGTVRDASNLNPLPGATVSVTGTSSRTTTTNGSGVYTLSLPIGTYSVTGSKFGFSSATVNGLSVTNGGTTTQDLGLAPTPTHSVSGHVRDGNGVALGGATVTVLNTPLASTTTDGSGAYSFASVPQGSYSVRAEPPNRCLIGATNALTVGGADVTNFDFSLPAKQDSFGYRCRIEATAFVNGTDLVSFSAPDDAATLVTLPFAFSFYGTSYSSANVTTNGLVSFTDASTSWANTGIPNAGSPNTAIYPYWDDLYVDSPTANVYTASLGSAPNRQFVIEWRNVRYFGDAARRVGFEVILNENGDVQTMYKDIAPGDGLEMGNSATVGIENQGGTVALQYSLNEAVLSTGLAVRYYVPSGGGSVAPVAANDSATMNEDGSATVNVLANDSDANGDPLSVRQADVSAPAHGTAVVNADNTITYTPAANSNGPDSFTYRAFDGTLSSNLATVNVTVNPVDDAPTVSVVVLTGTSACLSDTSPSGRVALTVADVDNDPATLTLGGVSSTAKILANAGLSLAGSGASRSLTAAGTGAKGNSTITITVSDGTLTGQTTLRFIAGTGGTNNLNGTSGADMLFGLAGSDKLNGAAGVDLLCGGAGNDTLTGGAAADFFSGGGGTDTNADFVAPDLWDGT